MTPYYSIESWLFQNTDEARERCRARGCARQSTHAQLLDEWAADRGLLDEVHRPKNGGEHSICLTSSANVALAKDLPVAEVVAAGKSLADAIRRLSTTQLLGALARTWAEADQP